MKKLLIGIALLFPVLSVAAGNPTIDVNQHEKLDEILTKIDSIENASFLIAYNKRYMPFTTNLTPVKNIETCEKLKSLLEKPDIKKEIYNGGVEFKCISLLNEK